MNKSHCCLVLLPLLLFIISLEPVHSTTCNGVKCPLHSYCSPITNNCTCKEVATPEEVHCGSDGQDYKSLQALQKYACQNNLTIYSVKKGPCYRCGDPRCHYYSQCNQKIGICECGPLLEIYAPVCGSDGRTYDSIYQLNSTACLEEKNVTYSHWGFCKGVGVCGHSSCHKYSECDRVTNKCRCKNSVNTTKNNVCGTDGKSYINEEILKVTACHNNQTIRKLHNGRCNATELNCTKCYEYAYCDPSSLQCECVSTVSSRNDYLCGTDMVTYMNEKELKRSSCIQNKNITVLHRGLCEDKRSSSGLDNLTIFVLVGIGGFVLAVFIIVTIICCVRSRKDDNEAPSHPLKEYHAPLM